MTYIPTSITMTDWADAGAHSVTTSSGSGSLAKGSVVEDAVLWKRVDDTLFAEYYYYQTSAGINGPASALLISLPNSLQFDTSKWGTIPSGDSTLANADCCIGHGHITITFGGTTYNYLVECYPYNSTSFWMCVNHTTTGGSFVATLGTNNFYASNPFIMRLSIKCPINGW